MRSFIPLLSLAFLAATAHADAYSHKEAFEQTNPFAANGTLTLQNVNGDVEVVTWDRNEIRIEGEKSARTEEELQLIDMTISTAPDRARVVVKLPKRQSGWFGGGSIRAGVRFKITMPATAHAEVNTVNGSVRIEGIRGSVDAESVNGAVRAFDVAGPVSISTVNGGVEAKLAALTTGTKLHAKSVNGGVRLRLPAATAATVDASTVNGGIDCDFPLEVTGKISGRRLRGTIGAGSGEIKASTVNGGIHIQKS